MRRTCILITDDEVVIIKLLQAGLEDEGWKTLVAMDGAQALHVIEMESPDLVILDLNMTKLDGYEVLRRLREWSQIPVIVISAQSGMNGKVKCLNLGADDYVTKPFGVEELIARVKAVLRRNRRNNSRSTPSSFTSGDLKIDFDARRVSVSGNEVRLTPTEFSLLGELVLNAGKVLTHTYLLKKIWGPEYESEREYLYVAVGHLRAKIELDSKHPKYIISVPGVGYRFQEAKDQQDV